MTVRTPIALLLVLAISTMPGVPPARTANQTAGLAAAVPATKVIRFGRIVDGRGAVLTNAVVIVQGDRIRSVSTSPSAVIADAEVIDLSRYTGLPAEKAGVQLVRAGKCMDKWRLDRKGIRAIPNTAVKKALGFGSGTGAPR